MESSRVVATDGLHFTELSGTICIDPTDPLTHESSHTPQAASDDIRFDDDIWPNEVNRDILQANEIDDRETYDDFLSSLLSALTNNNNKRCSAHENGLPVNDAWNSVYYADSSTFDEVAQIGTVVHDSSKELLSSFFDLSNNDKYNVEVEQTLVNEGNILNISLRNEVSPFLLLTRPPHNMKRSSIR